MSHTTADLLVERLVAWGVDTIFGLPGDGINGIIEALRTHQDAIKFIQVRHEESGCARGVRLREVLRPARRVPRDLGPRRIHLLNGLYDAKCDGQPVLAITATPSTT